MESTDSSSPEPDYPSPFQPFTYFTLLLPDGDDTSYQKLMRLSDQAAEVIREQVTRMAPDAACYLFGSRTIDHARGGDIDLLLLTPEKLPLSQIRGIRRGILNAIGEQKLDIVNFAQSSTHPFKQAALEHAHRL
jgi:hypothetical protein